MRQVKVQCRKCDSWFLRDARIYRINCYSCSPRRNPEPKPEESQGKPPGSNGNVESVTLCELREAKRLGTSQAETALYLARLMDSGWQSGQQAAALAGKFLEAMDKALAGADRKNDSLDELKARREFRAGKA